VKNVGDTPPAPLTRQRNMSEDDVSKGWHRCRQRRNDAGPVTSASKSNRHQRTVVSVANGEAPRKWKPGPCPSRKGEAAAENRVAGSVQEERGCPPEGSAGKLPPRPSELSKDSREAAADILREMTVGGRCAFLVAVRLLSDAAQNRASISTRLHPLQTNSPWLPIDFLKSRVADSWVSPTPRRLQTHPAAINLPRRRFKETHLSCAKRS
jgi:hypothetical protein